MEEKKLNKKKKITRIVALLGLFLLVFGISYALFSVVLNGMKRNRITTGNLSLKITDLEGNNEADMPDGVFAINMENTYPVADEEGLQLVSYDFKVVNDGTIDAFYKLNIRELTSTTLPAKVIKYNLIEDGENLTISPRLLSATTITKSGTEENLYQIDNDIVKVGEEKVYKLNLWIDYKATLEEAGNKIFEGNIMLNGSQITKDINVFKDGSLASLLTTGDIKGEDNGKKYFKTFDSTKEENGIYKYPDMNGGTTYYYRGTDLNNYVSFGGKTWRIVRVLEDGSIRLILDDVTTWVDPKGNTGGENGFATNHNGYAEARYYINSGADMEHLRYKGSNIESYLNKWYLNKLNDYDKYISMSHYCDDTREDVDNPFSKFYQLQGAENVFGIFSRGTIKEGVDFNHEFTEEEQKEILDSIGFNPNLTCRKEDKVETKVALLSADEYVLAGGGFGAGTNYLLKSNYVWWTMSSAELNSSYAGVYYVSADGEFNPYPTDLANTIRPVITLKNTVSISSGNGTSTDPYVIG